MLRILIVAMLAVSAGAARAEDAKSAVPGITITGSAWREVEPDRATITFGVTTERPNAADAANDNARAARAAVDAVVAAGIDGKDVQTSALSLAPVYSQASASQASAIRAYRASNQVTVRIRRIEAAGPLVQTLVEKGITNLSGPTFEVSNADATIDELRGEAAKDARRKADIVATALGVRIGRVLDVQAGAANYQPRVQAMRVAAAPAPAPPVERGTERLSADVTIVFEIAQ